MELKLTLPENAQSLSKQELRLFFENTLAIAVSSRYDIHRNNVEVHLFDSSGCGLRILTRLTLSPLDGMNHWDLPLMELMLPTGLVAWRDSLESILHNLVYLVDSMLRSYAWANPVLGAPGFGYASTFIKATTSSGSTDGTNDREPIPQEKPMYIGDRIPT